MRATLKRLRRIKERLHPDNVWTICRVCPACGARVLGADPGATPCGSHPLAPPLRPGEREIVLTRAGAH
jgi:hypothetical protein